MWAFLGAAAAVVFVVAGLAMLNGHRGEQASPTAPEKASATVSSSAAVVQADDNGLWFTIPPADATRFTLTTAGDS